MIWFVVIVGAVAIYVFVLGYLNTYHLPEGCERSLRSGPCHPHYNCHRCEDVRWALIRNLSWPASLPCIAFVVLPIRTIYGLPGRVKERRMKREAEIREHMAEVDALLAGDHTKTERKAP